MRTWCGVVVRFSAISEDMLARGQSTGRTVKVCKPPEVTVTERRMAAVQKGRLREAARIKRAAQLC